ncbi:MAG: hypothetical protein ACK5MN_00485 [Lachnospiraceae bacterium]
MQRKKTTKFKGGFVRGARLEAEKRKEQERLHDKYSMQETDTIVVEKSNMAKFMIRLLLSLIRVICSTAVIILAVVGLVSLLYPQVREELLQVWQQVLADVMQFTGR